jgi:hypothetical protein
LHKDEFLVAGIAALGALLLLLVLSFVVFNAIHSSGPTQVTVHTAP